MFALEYMAAPRSPMWVCFLSNFSEMSPKSGARAGRGRLGQLWSLHQHQHQRGWSRRGRGGPPRRRRTCRRGRRPSVSFRHRSRHRRPSPCGSAGATFCATSPNRWRPRAGPCSRAASGRWGSIWSGASSSARVRRIWVARPSCSSDSPPHPVAWTPASPSFPGPSSTRR